MKLKRFKLLSPFRGLTDGFEIYFLRDFDQAKMWDFMPYCLVGRNGSGKSNVLEALAAIFYHIECIYLDTKPNDFEQSDENPSGFDSKNSYPNAYELEYYTTIPSELIRLSSIEVAQKEQKNIYAHIRIEKKFGKRPEIIWLNREEYDLEGKQELERLEVRQLTPQYIVGYSSGENEILSLPFFKMRFIHFDEYADRLINQFDYKIPEGRLVYMDTSYSQAVLLTNFLMQGYKSLTPIYDTLNIEAIKTFRIIINRNITITEHVEVELNDDDFQEDVQGSTPATKYQLVSQIEGIINRLQLCSTTYLAASDHILYLDYYITEETQEAFRFHFENDPLKLFQAFQILLTLNFYDVSFDLKRELYQSDSLYVNETVPTLASDKRLMRFKDLTIKKKDIKEPILSKSLSDGEHQYLHAMGLCLLFKNTNSLFLLDEPETHFNPDWRATFISTLNDCLKDEKESHLRDLLITSHSPFIISDCKQENVLTFQKNLDGVTCERPDFNTFGASVNLITFKIFNKRETIGDYANVVLIDLEKRFTQGEDGTQLIDEINKLLGDSVEKIIFVNKILGKQNTKL